MPVAQQGEGPRRVRSRPSPRRWGCCRDALWMEAWGTAPSRLPQVQSQSERDILHKRCTWLNGNVFGAGGIDHEAFAALESLPLQRALELLKDVEAKGGQVRNPSGYLKTSVQREGSGGGQEGAAKRTRFLPL